MISRSPEYQAILEAIKDAGCDRTQVKCMMGQEEIIFAFIGPEEGPCTTVEVYFLSDGTLTIWPGNGQRLKWQADYEAPQVVAYLKRLFAEIRDRQKASAA